MLVFRERKKVVYSFTVDSTTHVCLLEKELISVLITLRASKLFFMSEAQTWDLIIKNDIIKGWVLDTCFVNMWIMMLLCLQTSWEGAEIIMGNLLAIFV